MRSTKFIAIAALFGLSAATRNVTSEADYYTGESEYSCWTDDEGNSWWSDGCNEGYTNWLTGESASWDCYGYYEEYYIDECGNKISYWESTCWEWESENADGSYDYYDSDQCEYHEDCEGNGWAYCECDDYYAEWYVDEWGYIYGWDSDGCYWTESVDGSYYSEWCEDGDSYYYSSSDDYTYEYWTEANEYVSYKYSEWDSEYVDCYD